MAINNKQLGSSAGSVDPANTGAVLPKLVNHTTTEQAFQEGLNDVAIQVDQTQIDIGYEEPGATSPTQRNLGTVADRLGSLETAVAGGATVGSTDPMGNPVGDIGGTLSDPQIRQNAVDTDAIAPSSITSSEIMDGTIVSADIAAGAGITRTQLEADVQSYNVTVGNNAATSYNLGADVTIPNFTASTTTTAGLDGTVDGASTSQVTTGTTTTDALWVLGSDANWHQLNTFSRFGASVPQASVSSTVTSHAVTIASTVSSTITVPAYLADATTRMGTTGTSSTVEQFALQNGDLISVTDERTTPNQVSAFVYIGPDLIATADGTAANFVRLGQADAVALAANGGLEFQTGTRNIQIQSTIPGARTFSDAVTFMTTTSHTGNATFAGDVIANGNVDLGNASSDTVTVNGVVDSNIIPDNNGTRALGSSAARWDVFADTLDASSITGTIGDSNIAADSLSVNRLDSSGGSAAQIPTINDSGSAVAWMDPPIGIQMVTTLTIGSTGTGVTAPTNVSVGTVVSLTQVDGTNTAGVYRAVSVTTDPMTMDVTAAVWQRLGTVNVILSKRRIQSSAGVTNYTSVGVTIAGSHLITIDGLVLVESVDYTVNSNRMGFTLTAAVAADKDIEIINFSDIATIGDGEIAVTALAPTGTLPSGISVTGTSVSGSVNSAINADQASSNSFNIGNWTLAQDSSGRLTFSNTTNGVVARIDVDGHIRSENDITAFDTNL